LGANPKTAKLTATGNSQVRRLQTKRDCFSAIIGYFSVAAKNQWHIEFNAKKTV
jgi:hypothetical protein